MDDTTKTGIYTTTETAKLLRIYETMLWKEREAGHISYSNIGRRVVFTRQDIDEYLERNKTEARTSTNG